MERHAICFIKLIDDKLLSYTVLLLAGRYESRDDRYYWLSIIISLLIYFHYRKVKSSDSN